MPGPDQQRRHFFSTRIADRATPGIRGSVRLTPFLLLLFCAAAHAVRFDALPLSGTTVLPSQTDVLLLKLEARNTGEAEAAITSLAVTYAGTAAGDIATGSVKLFTDVDGDWSTPGDRSLLSQTSFSPDRAVFGFSFTLSSGGLTYLFVSADVSSGAEDGNTINGEIADSSVDIVCSDGTQGPSRLRSLSTPYRIGITATRITAGPWTTDPVAGQKVEFTVSCIDADGTIDGNWSGSVLSVGGLTGEAPGVAPSGKAPEYTGGGAWSSSEGGRRVCSYTLYRAETGKKILVSDSILGSDSSPAISVAPAAVQKINMLPVPGQTAGVPFTVTIYTSDAYGNARGGHAGSVTTLSAEYGFDVSPDGTPPVLPGGSAWSGVEPSGQKTFTVITYARSDAARLKAGDTALGSALSNEFPVAEGSVAQYEVEGSPEARMRTPTAVKVTARDAWGNIAVAYAESATVSCTDTVSEHPATVSFASGNASLSISFGGWGRHTLTVRAQDNPSVFGMLDVDVNRPPLADRFIVDAPEAVTAGRPFTATITAADQAGGVIADYNGGVSLRTSGSAAVSPSQVTIVSGTWSGPLSLSGEALEVSLIVSDGDVTSSSPGLIRITIARHEKAITYPTVFRPRERPLRIRYFLKEQRQVNVTIFNLAMDPVREFSFPPGSPGAQAGLNVIEWDGRGGNDGATGHSGGYHILIDKGYEKEWTGAVIKNY